MRGLYYFLLVSNFGEEVPYIDKTPKTTADYNHPNSPKGLIYQKIINDFTSAIDLLPTRSEMKTKYNTYCRATKGSAQGFLAKVYMYSPFSIGVNLPNLTKPSNF